MPNERKEAFKDKYMIYLKGIVAGLVVTAAFVVLFSLLMLVLDLNYRFAAPFATVSVAAGSFIAAYITSKSIGSKGYLVGAAVGIIVFLIVTVVALIVNKSGVTNNTLFHFIIITLSSVLGGIMGVNKKGKKYI